MQKKVRRQLTLFVNPNDAINIEKIRRMYNPVQFDLIKAHVTLCREDEIIDQDRVLANLYNISKKSFTVNFGKVVRFEEGKGVLIPALKDNVEFYGLRASILNGLFNPPRIFFPHITLMHPRNSLCTDTIFYQIQKYLLPAKLTFHSISLIEQENAGKWKTLEEFKLFESVS